jgi:HEPN domain-containing protein
MRSSTDGCSLKQPEAEAARWLAQAQDDVQFARWLLSEGRGFDKGCFIAQQAAEKALKAVLYLEGARSILGHSVADLLKRAATKHSTLTRFRGDAMQLDRFYIPTRYPNGLPAGTPFENYAREDLEKAVVMAEGVVSAAAAIVSDG